MSLLVFISKIQLCFPKLVAWYLEDSGVSTYTCRVSIPRGSREGGGVVLRTLNTFPSKRLTLLLQRTPSLYYKIV